MKTIYKSCCLRKPYQFSSVAKIRLENFAKDDLGDRKNIFIGWQMGIALAVSGAAVFSGNHAIAQLVPDQTLGTENSTITRDVEINGITSDRIDGGAIRGSGLFHSFQEFNVTQGRGVYFSNPAGIENIFSRVTGSNASNINGRLGVLGNANLFLLNPNGILFGPNASLDIGGSFLASTANSLKFGNGKEFSASNPQTAPLLTVSVPLGVQFNQQQPSAIANFGNLSVGQNLTLLGGTVISTGDLSAPQGQVAVAAVPGGSVVNLSSTGQFFNIDTSSTEVSGNSSSSLAEFLQSSDRPELTVNNQQVELTGSGLSVVDGDVVAKNVSAQSATLTANHNLTLVESQLTTTSGDLNLLAGDTVRVRDSAANSFLAQAGGNLTIQGNKGIDILALNHPQTPFVSGGNLSLISDGNISGDAHFSSGGNFSILNLSGNGGNFVSLYDPIISANGDVQFGNYEGAALKVESTGSIIGGNITITSPDTGLADNTNDQEDVDLLQTTRSVILRAGLDSLVYSAVIPRTEGGTDFTSTTSSLPNGSIQVGNINTSSSEGNAGSVILSASGSIDTGSINTRVQATGSGSAGNVYLEANGNIRTGGDIDAGVDAAEETTGIGGNITLISRNGNVDTSAGELRSTTSEQQSGDIRIEAAGDITTANILSFIGGGGTGNGGNITLISQGGEIDTTQGDISSATPSGTGGNIYLEADGNVNIANVRSRITPIEGRDDNQGNAGNITIISNNGNINASEGEILSSTPNGQGGNIELRAEQGQITTTGITITAKSDNGVAGNITLRADQDIHSGNITASSNSSKNDVDAYSTIRLESLEGTIFLNQVQVNAKNTGSDYAGIIEIYAYNNIEITGNRVIDINGNETGVQNIINDGYYGIIDIYAGGNISIENSILTAQSNNDLPLPSSAILSNEEGQLGNSQAGEIAIYSGYGNIDISNSSLNTTTENENASAGDIWLYTANGDISISENSSITSSIKTEDDANLNVGGIYILTDEITVESGSEVTVSSPEGQAGDIVIYANKIFLNNGTLSATAGSNGNGANIFLDGLEEDSQLAFLIMQNESLITADARNSAQGGNITIDTELLLALPPTGEKGSDITANAAQGTGGRVNITARPLGIYGIEYRKGTQGTSLNDITASSQQGQEGIVSIGQPDVDPSRGLIQLPEDLGDSSKLIAQSCPVGGQQATSSFVVTGRGGLPPNPGSALSSGALVGNSGSSPPQQNSSAPVTPVEAQGVNLGPNGEIILTANPKKPASNNSWQRFVGCYGK